jgi:hypothetical protein
LSAVRLFFGADFILSEFTDISFEVKAVLCFYFYTFRDVFRRNGIVQQNRIAGNRFELERRFPKDAANLHQSLFSLQSRHLLGIYLWHTYPLIFNNWIIQRDIPAHRGIDLLWKFPALLLGISVTGIVLNFLIDLLDKWCCLKILSEKAVRLFADRCSCYKNR